MIDIKVDKITTVQISLCEDVAKLLPDILEIANTNRALAIFNGIPERNWETIQLMIATIRSVK